MNKEEQLKKFMKKFELQYVPAFTKFILESYDTYFSFFKVVDKLKRDTDEFKNLSKYHIEALNNMEYNKNYQRTIEKINREGYEQS